MKKMVMALVLTVAAMVAVIMLDVKASAAPPPQVEETVQRTADGKTITTRKEVTTSKEPDGSTKITTVTTVVTEYVDAEGYTVRRTQKTTNYQIIRYSSSSDSSNNSSSNGSSKTKPKHPKKYKDVSTKKLAKTMKLSYKKARLVSQAIEDQRKAGAFDGVYTGKKFCPTKKVTEREVYKILRNKYKEAPSTKGRKKVVTNSFVKRRMIDVAVKRGYTTIKWPGSNQVATRGYVALWLNNFDSYLATKE